MKALVVLAALAGTAVAGDPEPPFAMQRVAGPPRAHLDETRFVPELGALWRYGPTVVLYDGSEWRRASGAVPSDEHTEIAEEQTRLDVIVRGGHVAFAVTATSKWRDCHGSGNCDAWKHVTNRVVCWKEPQLLCVFE